MAEPTLGQHLAAFAADTSAATLPDEVVASVRARVLDVLGLCVAAQPLPTSQAALAYVAEQGGRGQATAVGVDEKVPAALAAFANGVLAHSLDYDDTHLPSVLHPSATVVPAALAAAEMSGASGQETVAAIAPWTAATDTGSGIAFSEAFRSATSGSTRRATSSSPATPTTSPTRVPSTSGTAPAQER